MESFMKVALSEAIKANKKGEVPIGAVVVLNGKIISKAHNKREKSKCAVDHAEILAIKKACKKLKDWRLENCEIYVTLEPCLMCFGAILNSRIKKLVYGASDNKTNAKQFLLSKNNSLNHNLEIQGGVLKDECSNLLKNFFQKARNTCKVKKIDI